jgi:DNA polymerase alpha subunit A
VVPSSDDELNMSVRGKRRRLSRSPSLNAEYLNGVKTCTTEAAEKVEQDEYDAFFMDDQIDYTAIPEAPEAPESTIVLDEFAKKTEKVEEPALPSWLSLHASLDGATDYDAETASKSPLPSSQKVMEDDGSLYMYWLDYKEDGGVVHLVGKAKDKVSGQWLSCCASIEGIQRNIFVLPRASGIGMSIWPLTISIPTIWPDFGVETDEGPSEDSIESEVDAIRRDAKIRSYGTKWVMRNYAFGDRSIPTGESKWLKVVYGFNRQKFFQ